MKKLRLQNYLLASVFLYVFVATTWSLIPVQDEASDLVKLISPKSEIEGREDLQSRSEYNQAMLANPETGEVPINIRTKELSFAASQMNFLSDLPKSANGASVSRATQSLNWSHVGPGNFGGRTRAVGMDVRNENILLAGGVSGGMWRSNNQGASWVRSSTNEEIQSVTALTQNVKPGQEDIWYYGTGELVGNSPRAPGAPFRGDGIFRSVDNGTTWKALASTQTNSPGLFNSPFQYVWDITTNPNGMDDEILAAIYGGIVRSTDGGVTWTTVLGNDLLNFPLDQDLNDVPAVFYTDIHRTSAGVFVASLPLPPYFFITGKFSYMHTTFCPS